MYASTRATVPISRHPLDQEHLPPPSGGSCPGLVSTAPVSPSRAQKLKHAALPKTPNPTAPDTAPPLESKDCCFSSSHFLPTLSGLLSKEKLLPPNPQIFTLPGALSPNLHSFTLWLSLRKLHLFKPLPPCKENTGDETALGHNYSSAQIISHDQGNHR